MFTEKESKDWLVKGEDRAIDPFLTGSIKVPEKLLEDLPDVNLSEALVVSLVDEKTGVTTRAKKSEVRQAKSITINENQYPQYWALWKEAEGLVREWQERFPQYFSIWRADGGELVRYDKNDYFKLHRDAPSRTRREVPITPEDPLYYRAVIMCIGLSDKDSYEGGELTFPSEGKAFKLGLGDILVFPAVMLHYLTEITQGSRYIIFGGAFCEFTNNANLELYCTQFDRTSE